MHFRNAISLMLIALLTDCALGISYRPAIDDSDFGYRDEAREDGTYWVGFLG